MMAFQVIKVDTLHTLHVIMDGILQILKVVEGIADIVAMVMVDMAIDNHLKVDIHLDFMFELHIKDIIMETHPGPFVDMVAIVDISLRLVEIHHLAYFANFLEIIVINKMGIMEEDLQLELLKAQSSFTFIVIATVTLGQEVVMGVLSLIQAKQLLEEAYKVVDLTVVRLPHLCSFLLVCFNQQQ